MVRNTGAHRVSPTNSTPGYSRSTQPEFGLQLPLQRHQTEGVEWLLQPGNERVLIADEVGLGKTAMVIAYLSELLARDDLPHVGRQRLARVLWVTDVTLLPQTLSEFERFAPHVKALAVTKDDLDRKTWRKTFDARFPEGADVLVMGYETTHSRRHFLTPAHSFSAVILDEAGKLRGGGEIWKTVRAIAAEAPRVIGLTATPMENHPIELFNVLAAIGTPHLWTRSKFESEFVSYRTVSAPGSAYPQSKPDGWATEEHAAAVGAYLRRVMLRRTSKQVSLSLPVNVTEEPVIWVEPYADQQEAYEKAARNRNQAQGFHDQQRAGFSAGESSAMLDRLVELLVERGERQAIVFNEYREVLEQIGERLTEAGISHVVIQGSVQDKNRQDAVDRFTRGEVRVLVGNVVLERGLNLQTCNLLISVGTSWNPAREAQREGRIRRARSEHAEYEHLTLMPTTRLSEAQWATLARKRDTAMAVGL